MGKKKVGIVFNSPIILGFATISLAALLLNLFTKGVSNMYLFSVYRSSLINPLTYLRMITHVFGHTGVDHFMGNMMLLLVIGPLLEEKYGSFNLLFIFFATALLTGIVHMLIFPYVRLLGASGIVFACILLASFTTVKEDELPFTFILVGVLYIGQEIYSALFRYDSISNLTHILGGCIGGFLGYLINRYRIEKY